VDGNFVPDYHPPAAGKLLEDLDLEQQRAMLDRAAMEFCIADVFEPGVELPWIVRDKFIYEDYETQEWMFPRIKAAAPGFKEPDYGAYLDYEATSTTGQIPGGLTRWLGVPWQSDHASCLAGYTPILGRFVPALWPAGVPNHVLTEAAYSVVMDGGASPADRMKAFRTRVPWQPNSGGSQFGQQVSWIAANPDQLGVITARPGPKTGEFPDWLYVDDRAQS
jgi:hypothetical protein